MEASDVRRLKDLEDENAQLKKMYAYLALDNRRLKDLFTKRLGPATKEQLSREIAEEEGISVSRACKIVFLPRVRYYYKRSKDDTEVVVETLQELAFKHTDYGFRKLYLYIRRSSKVWNHKKIYRIYKLLKLHKRPKVKRRIPARVKQPLQPAVSVNETWSMDFMSDSMVNSRKFRTLTVIDDATGNRN